jgi:hypothetical protein
MYRGSAFSYICSCGRSFTQPGALKYHQNACIKRKKELSNVLARAKERAVSVNIAPEAQIDDGGAVEANACVNCARNFVLSRLF